MLSLSWRSLFSAAAVLAFSSTILVASHSIGYAATAPVIGPYKNVPIDIDSNGHMRVGITGKPIPLVGKGSLKETALPQLNAITLAFATGECGEETWADTPADKLAKATLRALSNAGVKYKISVGSEQARFTCSTNEGMEKFLRRYDTPGFIGIDYNISAGTSSELVADLIKSAEYATSHRPGLRPAFSLATWAGSDGNFGGLNDLGREVVTQLKASSLKDYIINLLAHNYGQHTTAACVLAGDKCDMGKSAIQAAKNLTHSYGIPANQTELTLKIGITGSAGEVTTVDDVKEVASYVLSAGLAGLRWWALDRDAPCSDEQISATCSGTPDTPRVGYSRAFYGSPTSS